MLKNTASQKLTVFAFADAGHATLDAGEPVTGDAANITCKVEQDDDGTQDAVADTNPTEVEDGQYRFDLTQGETNGNKLTFYPQSSTAGVQVVALPSAVIYTRPPNFSALGIESDGDLTKVNTLNGHTPQTADHAASIAAILLDTAEIGTAGAGLTDLGGMSTAMKAQVKTEADAALTDYDGPTKTELDTAESNIINAVNAVNTGAARYISIATNVAYELPDSGTVDYPIEVRTFDGDGEPVDIDAAADPTVTVTRTTDSTDLSSQLSAITHPATGIYRMTFTVDESTDIIAPLRIDASGAIASVSRSTSAYPVITDSVAVDFTAADRAKLDTLHDTRITAGRAANLDNLDAAITTRMPTFTLPTNFGSLAIDANGNVRVGDGGYVDGCVYIATNGAPGTTVGVNGTIANPIDNWADAITVATALGFLRIRLLTTDFVGPTFQTLTSVDITGFDIDLNGGMILWHTSVTTSQTTIRNGVIFPSSSTAFRIGTSLVAGDRLVNILVYGAANLGGGGLFDPESVKWGAVTLLDHVTTRQIWRNFGAYSTVDGVSPSILDCAGFKLLASMPGWYGDLELRNMTFAASVLHVYGWGKLTIKSTCTTGTIRHTSHIEIVDESGGAVTTELISEPSGVGSLTSDAQQDVRDAMKLAASAGSPAAASIDTYLIDILDDTNELQSDDVPGLIAALPTQAEITGGAYALDTDANGRIRIVDGTGAGELDTASGRVLLTAATESQIDSIEADTNELQTDDVPGLIAALNDLSFADVWTPQLTESYAANGVVPSPAESLLAIHQLLMDFAIAGTAYSVKKIGSAVEAFAAELDDETNPTSLRRP